MFTTNDRQQPVAQRGHRHRGGSVHCIAAAMNR
jgi:hypothetical protein